MSNQLKTFSYIKRRLQIEALIQGSVSLQVTKSIFIGQWFLKSWSLDSADLWSSTSETVLKT